MACFHAQRQRQDSSVVDVDADRVGVVDGTVDFVCYTRKSQ